MFSRRLLLATTKVATSSSARTVQAGRMGQRRQMGDWLKKNVYAEVGIHLNIRQICSFALCIYSPLTKLAAHSHRYTGKFGLAWAVLHHMGVQPTNLDEASYPPIYPRRHYLHVVWGWANREDGIDWCKIEIWDTPGEVSGIEADARLDSGA